jgi:hypothetical protein
MSLVFAVLFAAVQVHYQARVLTFGCNSSTEVAELQRIRSDAKTFQKRFLELVTYGQCIAIAKGAVVEGAVESADRSVLRVEAASSPPGYMAPVSDFRPVGAAEKPEQ